MSVRRFALVGAFGGIVASAMVAGCGGKVLTSNDSAGSGGAGGAPKGGGGFPAGGTGGAGGAPMGGSGGVSAGGGIGIGGSGGAPCGSRVCPSYELGVVEMAACCVSTGECGATVDELVSDIIVIPPGCYRTGSPGSPDPSCPPKKYDNPLDGQPAEYPGCCRAGTGMCGVQVDLTKYSGPDLGCADVSEPDVFEPQPCGSSQDCQTCVQSHCSQELQTCAADPDCVQIISCTAACRDPSCADKCVLTNPNGASKFKMIQTCAAQKCATECQ
jgi:hypothetical protein